MTSITRVTAIGDQKFEVITTNRNFAFRAESDGEPGPRSWREGGGKLLPSTLLGAVPFP